MKKLKFINRLIAMMFMAVALVACSSSSKDDDDDDDDDDGKKKEKVGKIGKFQDEEEGEIKVGGSHVDDFCSLLNEASVAVDQASDESEVENLQARFKDRMNPFKSDNTPLTANEKEEIISALANFFGTILDKAVVLSGEDIDQDELYQAGVALGQQIRSLVEQSNSLADVCENIRNM